MPILMKATAEMCNSNQDISQVILQASQDLVVNSLFRVAGCQELGGRLHAPYHAFGGLDIKDVR